MMFEAATKAYSDAGLDPRTEIDSFLSCSEDFNEGTSIFDEYVPDQIGAAQRPVYTVGGDAIHGLATAYMQIMSGIVSVVAVETHSKASNVRTLERIHALALDPVFVRPLGLNAEFVAGLEADSFFHASGSNREHCAHVVAKNRRNALANPAAAYGASVEADDVLASPPAFEPLSQLDVSASADGGAVVVLASEERAGALDKRLAWIKGIGWANGSFSFAGRDWGDAAYAREAGEMAYRMAGVKEPRREIDFAEVDDTYSYKELQHLEALGIFERGEAGPATVDGVTGRGGDFPVNVSGGSLGVGRLLEASGAQRVIEVVQQLRGEAGPRQIPGVHVGLAQSWRGVPTVSGAVVILSSE
jgi:acetyl-CoA C-acetyltransferase